MNSFGSRSELKSGNRTYEIFRLSALAKKGIQLERLPYSLRILLENLLRHEDGNSVTADDIEFLAKWDAKAEPSREIAYMPARVLMQDFTGVPAIVDLAARTPNSFGPLAAQSRDDPEPYSLPARMTSGVFRSAYFTDASKMLIGSPPGSRRVTPPSVPGASLLRRRTLANVPRTITSWLPRREP